MKHMSIILSSILSLISCSEDTTKSNILAHEEINGIDYQPKMVGPNIISKSSFEGHASITPDGNEIYFTVYSNDHSYSTIAFSIKKEEVWSEPQIVNFSGKYSDGSPALSPDGKKLFFSSKRPVNGRTLNNSNDIWYVERITKNEWGEPKRIVESGINTGFNEFSPSVDLEGNLFFCSNRPNGYGDMDIYYTEYQNGIYQSTLLLGDSINSEYHEGNVGVSPNGKMLFIMIQNKQGDFGYDDIHYSIKEGKHWSKVKNIGSIINTHTYDFSPKISPDGQMLYFSSRINRNFNSPDTPYTYKSFQNRLNSPLNGLGNIYRIELSKLNLQQDELLMREIQ